MTKTVVNEKRVKQMSQLAVCENKIGKEPFRLNSYYQKDYIRLQELKTLVSTTIVYCLCFVAYLGVRLEYIIDHVMELDYKKMGIIGIGSYGLLIVLSVFITKIIAKRKYERDKEKLRRYSKLLKALEKSYEEEVDTVFDERKEGRQ